MDNAKYIIDYLCAALDLNGSVEGFSCLKMNFLLDSESINMLNQVIIMIFLGF